MASCSTTADVPPPQPPTITNPHPSAHPTQSVTDPPSSQLATQESRTNPTESNVYSRRRPASRRAPVGDINIPPGQGGMGVMYDAKSGAYIYNVSILEKKKGFFIIECSL